jgi:hypothetical protein
MQPTYYERLLADQRLKLASTLDEDIARLKAAGPLFPLTEDARLAECRGRYVKGAIDQFKQTLASSMSAEQFERFQQTPSYHEALVQKATQQYWTYETFLYLRAHGERTLRLGPEVSKELLSAPLDISGSEFRLEVPAAMLVFESAELVDAFYAGERRTGPGRHHHEAPLCVLALELSANTTSRGRYLRVLSVHGDGEHDYRVELRQFVLADRLPLEDILDAVEATAWHGGEEVEQLIGLPACKLAWASRKADSGFYAAKTPYYRAVLGALHCAETAPQRLSWHPNGAPLSVLVSALPYNELLPLADRR